MQIGSLHTYLYYAFGKTITSHQTPGNPATTTTTTHIWNGSHIALELNGNGAVINRFHRGLGHIINSDHHGWYVFNVRGDVVQRVDGHGNIMHTYMYDGFGNQLNQDHQNTNPFRFAGEYYDWETSTICLRARVFNPRTGRFIQPDPFWGIHNMQGSNAAILQAGNLFVYTVNNPVRWIDPSGLSKAGTVGFPPTTGFPATQPTGQGSGISERDIEAFMAGNAIACPRTAENLLRLGTEVIIFLLLFFGAEALSNYLEPFSFSGATQGGGDVFVGGVNITQMNVLTAELSDIAGGFAVGQCVEAANAMADHLRKNGQNYMFAEFMFEGWPNRNFVVSRSRGWMTISDNGYHIGILFNGRIFCNVHPQGLPHNAWFADFEGLGGRFNHVGPAPLGGAQLLHLLRQQINPLS